MNSPHRNRKSPRTLPPTATAVDATHEVTFHLRDNKALPSIADRRPDQIGHRQEKPITRLKPLEACNAERAYAELGEVGGVQGQVIDLAVGPDSQEGTGHYMRRRCDIPPSRITQRFNQRPAARKLAA